MSDIEQIERQLRGLLKGEYSQLILTFNDFASNYVTAKQWDEELSDAFHGDWVSEDEKQKALATNSVWTLQWYPDTPVGFFAIHASSLAAIFAHIADDFPAGNGETEV